MNEHDARQKSVVRAEVRRVLEKAPAYQELPEAERLRIARDMARIAGWIARADDPAAASSRVVNALSRGRKAPQEKRDTGGKASPELEGGARGATARGEKVDVPEFVAALLQGTFQAVIDATIQQMRAYAELLREVTKAIEDGTRESKDDDDD